jgi:hypothetical protein
VHRQEQQVRRAHQRDRLTVREHATCADERMAVDGGRVLGGELAGEMQLDRAGELGVGRQRRHEEHGRAREDVQAASRPAEQPPPGPRAAQVVAERRVQGSRVHDPEDVAGLGDGAVREVGAVEADRDAGGHDAIGELGERRAHARRGLRGGHHDRGRGRQRPAHRADIERPVPAAVRKLRLVERPQVLEVGDPGHAELSRHARGRERGLVGKTRRVDDVGAGPDRAGQAGALVHPPAHPRGRNAQDPADPGRARRLRAGNPVHRDVRRNAREQLLVARPPAVVPTGRTGDDDRLVAV